MLLLRHRRLLQDGNTEFSLLKSFVNNQFQVRQPASAQNVPVINRQTAVVSNGQDKTHSLYEAFFRRNSVGAKPLPTYFWRNIFSAEFWRQL